MKLIRTAFFAAALLPAAVLAQEAPDQLVKRVSDEILTLMKSDKDLAAGNQGKVIAVAEEKILPHFDFERMTRLAVGRNWQQATEPQRQALVKEFRTLIVRTYSTSLSQYRDQKIDVKPAKLAAGDNETIVRTAVLQQGGPAIPIDYGMAKGDKGWKVYDIIVDGVSLVTTYRGSFSDQIQKGGVDGLVKTLAERNAGPVTPPKPVGAKGDGKK